MAPPKRTAEMPESSNKRMKLTETQINEDLVEHIMSTFLPSRSLSRNRALSQRYRDIAIRSRNLDFGDIFYERLNQLEAVGIIDNIFNNHKGSEIHRFVLCLDHIGVENKIISWINTCIDKNIQELVLDFYKSEVLMEVLIDFSAIKTLKVLKLRWCRFEINNSPKGLRLLRTLSLVGTTALTNEMIDVIFRNCIRLESLELIACGMVGKLSINAQNHKKFKSLVVSSMPNLWHILLDAPTLEYYEYDGYVIDDKLLRPDALKEANLHYKRKSRRRFYDSSALVVANMGAYTGVNVLTTTNIFLEALTKRYVGGGIMEKKSTLKFENLTEFNIFFKRPTICTLFDIAEFLKDCPKLKKVSIDIKNFTFEPQLLFWEIHHKYQIENNKYCLELLGEVRIIGYKGHCHELDIVEFFVKNAPSLTTLVLEMPRDAKKKAHIPDYERIKFIKSIFPGIVITEV